MATATLKVFLVEGDASDYVLPSYPIGLAKRCLEVDPVTWTAVLALAQIKQPSWLLFRYIAYQVSYR